MLSVPIILGEQKMGLLNLSRYFDKLKNYARVIETDKRSNSIRQTIEMVLTLMKLRIEKYNIRVTTGYEHDLIFVFDKGQVEQVISNLVLNAIQAMQQGGGRL